MNFLWTYHAAKSSNNSKLSAKNSKELIDFNTNPNRGYHLLEMDHFTATCIK